MDTTRLRHEIEWEPAYDKRDPNPSKNYGIHGVECRWLVIGEEGAIQFLLYTNWQLPHIDKEVDRKALHPEFPHLLCRPMPADLGYHSKIARYEGQEPISGTCDYLGGVPCYYDGSGLRARKVFDLLVKEGGDAVWLFLDQEYTEVFRSEEVLHGIR